MRKNNFAFSFAFLAFSVAWHGSNAAPACVNPGAKNFIVASAVGDLTEDSWGGKWLIENVDTKQRIILRRCSEDRDNTCYFATNVKPGKYYFKRAVANGRNNLDYPVSKPTLWFPITDMGVDYIGHWAIQRHNRIISKLQISYDIHDLDSIVALCKLENRKLYLDRTKSDAHQIVD